MARLIDTSVFVALERRGDTLSALEAITFGELVALASITASELLVGVHRAASDQQRQRRLDLVERIVGKIPVIPFDLDTAETHAWLTVELSSAGQTIGAHDLLIAATALTRSYAVLTHNARHFRRVPGLQVDEPAW